MRYSTGKFLIAALVLAVSLPARAEKVPSGGNGPDMAGEEIQATELAFHPGTGQIKYTLPRDALVRIRIGMRDGGPLLAHLLDWEFRPKGKHEEFWDITGDTALLLNEFRLGAVAVINCRAWDQDREPDERQKRLFRESPGVTMTFPGAERTKDGLPILKDVAPVRVVIDPADAAWLEATKYEVTLFIDEITIFDDEEGINPYTFPFNTKGISNGEHLITVNVVGYQGQIGTLSRTVWIDNEIKDIK